MTPWRGPRFADFRALRQLSIVSSLEDGAFTVVLPVLAQQASGSTGVAMVFVATTAPWAVSSLPLGYLADRLSRTRLALYAACLRTVAAVALCVLVSLGGMSGWVVASAAFVLGTCGVASEIFRQSLVPDLVRETALLLPANAEIARLGQLFGGFVGPFIGGALMLWSNQGAAVVLGLLAAVTLAVTARLPVVAAPVRDAEGHRRLGRELFSGVELIARNSTLRTLAGLSFAVSLIWFVWETTFTAYALAPKGLNSSSVTYSFLLLAVAAGAVVGSQAVRRITTNFSLKTTLVGSLMAWTVWFVTPALTRNYAAIVACLILGGAAGLMWATVSMTARQLLTDGHLLGRTTAAYRMLTRTGRSLGAAIAGVLMTSYTWTSIFAVCAIAITFVAVAIALGYRDRFVLAEVAK